MGMTGNFGVTVFFMDESGAVAADWIALTAGILLLGMMIVYTIFNNGVSTLSASMNETLASVAVAVDVGPPPYMDGASALASPDEETTVASNESQTREQRRAERQAARDARRAERAQRRAQRQAARKANRRTN